MPRTSKKPMLSRVPKPRKAANALGYAKRKSLKSKTMQSAADVYEYQPEKVRRSKIQLVLDKDEISGARGEISDEEDDEGGTELRPRLVGEGENEEGLGDDEDDDIDSDDAFDDSDEERFAGFQFSHKKLRSVPKPPKSAAKGVHFAEVDLNEDSDHASVSEDEDGEEQSQEEDAEEEEEEEEGDPDEFIDVLDILDGRGEPESEDNLGKVERDESRRVSGSEDGSVRMVEDGGESNDDEDSEDAMAQAIPIELDEDDDIEDSALQNLQSFITGLDAGTKRKAPDDGDDVDALSGDSRKRKRRLLKEKTQVGTENEFAAQTGSTKLNLDDLLTPLASSSANLQSLKKSAKVLASTSSKAKTLAAPLPQRTQERLDRQAAYEQTKEEIDKWGATMKRIKEAEHLSFPLQAEPIGRPSNLELAAKFKPTTEMESAVDKLLKSAKMREQDIAQTESLKMNHLSVEEVAARRAELAKMRDLMFRNEAKAKRIAKIKSKTYRRLKKKQKDKLAAKIAELEGEDDDDDVQMKMEVDRARERATLRHKNTGKWAKAMKARGGLEEDQRQEIHDMLDRGERLRRRIQGQDSGDDNEDEDDDETEDDGDGARERFKAGIYDELAKLREDSEEDPSLEAKKGKSVFEMKFMKDAALREKHRVDNMADDFVKEMNGLGSEEASDEGEPEGAQTQNAAVQRVGGRVSFRPGNVPALRIVPSLASDTSSVTLKSTDLLPTDHPESPVSISPLPETHAAAEPSNPWLSVDGAKTVQKKHEMAVSKDSAGAEKSKNKLRKRAKKREEEKAQAKDDAAVDISLSNVLTLGVSKASTKGKQKAASGPRPASAIDDEDVDADSEVDEQEKRLELKGKGRAKGVKAFEQRDLIALAFAGDNVVQDFSEAKRREIQEDAPKEVDTTIPGWGSWGGLGAKKAPPKPYLIKKVAGVDPTSRSDFNKAHVIISERRDKKAAKYMVKDLPFPYTSKAQFERSMDAPIGSEWNTRVGFQRGTLPKVVKKMGAVITPLEKLT